MGRTRNYASKVDRTRVVNRETSGGEEEPNLGMNCHSDAERLTGWWDEVVASRV